MSDQPETMDQFLAEAGWGDAAVEAIPGDASFRRYFRLKRGTQPAMLMYAPPPEEDPRPFLKVGDYLISHGMRAPEIYAADPAQGWVLLEDFGDDRMRDWLDNHPEGEDAAYRGAIDALIELATKPAGPFAPYDMATYQREAALFTQWYCPAMGLEIDDQGFVSAWENALGPVIARQQPGVTVLRDYHAENIMLLGDPRDGAPQGLIDFQDALVGHPAYDLVSLLQDARRDVPVELERNMLDHYCKASGADADFMADYAVLGAQRNAKIVGIFTRLFKRDGKARYLDFIPRVWQAMERDLAHPALAPVADWFDTNVPAALRDNDGGSIS